MRILGAFAAVGFLVMLMAWLAWRSLGYVEDSSLEEMYEFFLFCVWACGGFLVAVAGLGVVVAWLAHQKAKRSTRA